MINECSMRYDQPVSDTIRLTSVRYGHVYDRTVTVYSFFVLLCTPL